MVDLRLEAARSIVPGFAVPGGDLKNWVPKDHKPGKAHLEQAVKERDPQWSLSNRTNAHLVSKLLATPKLPAAVENPAAPAPAPAPQGPVAGGEAPTAFPNVNTAAKRSNPAPALQQGSAGLPQA